MSVEKTKYGTWRVRWRDAAGRQKAKTFDRKIDADNHERAVRTDLKRGDYIAPDAGKTTVREWASTWLDSAHNLKQGGIDTYRRDLDRYILPDLGRLPLAKLSGAAIDRYLADMKTRGIASSTRRRHYATIRRMCQAAVERQLLAKNPCDTVEPPHVEETEMRFLDAGQVDALATAISDRYRAWVYVAAYDGLRWSETVGLRRAHVDGERVTVLEQLIKRADGRWHRDAPKTKRGVRTITSPAFLVDELDNHLATYSQPTADGLVFVNQYDRHLGPSFAANVFKPALRRAGLDPKTRIHDLRHTAVALAIKAGAHPKAIQVRMGHASINVTLDRYGHLFPEMDAELAAGLDGLRGAA